MPTQDLDSRAVARNAAESGPIGGNQAVPGTGKEIVGKGTIGEPAGIVVRSGVTGSGFLDPDAPNPPDVLGQQFLFEGAPSLHIGRAIFQETVAGIESRVLANDIKVHFLARSGFEVLLMVKAGALQDPLDKTGLAHFVEHMCFGGTENHPTATSFARRAFAEGLSLNAFTDRTTTVYSLSGPSYKAEEALRLVGEMMRAPRFDEQEIMNQRSIVAHENYEMFEGNNFAALHQLQFERLVHGMWGGNHPVLGYPDHVATITRADVAEFYDRYYHGGAMEALVAGSVTPHVLSLVDKHLGAIHSKGAVHFSPGTARSAEEPERLDWRTHARNGSVLYVTFPAIPEISTEGAAGYVLRSLINRAPGSPLHEMMRFELAATYGQGIFLNRSPAGTFDTVAFANTRPDGVHVGLQGIERAIAVLSNVDEVRRLLDSPHMNPRELPKIPLSVTLQNLALHGHALTPDQLAQRVPTVGPEEVAAYAQTHLDPAKAKIAVRSNLAPHGLRSPWA